MQIRLATLDDAETISILSMDVQKIHAEALPRFFKTASKDTFSPATIREWLGYSNNYFYIADVDGQPIGYIFAEVRYQPETSWRYAMDSVFIHHISLKPEYQSKGYGEKLMDAVKALAKENGISTVALDVWSFNTKAKTFFRKQGFENFNERMWMELDA